MKIKEDDYEKYANCIQMEQMAAPEIAELFEDGKFSKWYRKKYNLDSDRDDTSQEEWIEGYNKWQTKKERCPHN